MKVKANVILAKCSKKNEIYGIRVEERNGDWVRTWAFPIMQYMAEKEGFDKVQLSGSFNAIQGYPGCPYCGRNGFFICGKCRKINCWNGEEHTTCLWCENQGTVRSSTHFDIAGGGY